MSHPDSCLVYASLCGAVGTSATGRSENNPGGARVNGGAENVGPENIGTGIPVSRPYTFCIRTRQKAAAGRRMSEQ